MLDLFAAIKARYLSTDLATTFTAISAVEEFHDARRPYLVAYPMSDTPLSRTNVGRYTESVFEIHVIADVFEDATAGGYLVQDRLLDPVLHFTASGDRLMAVNEGRVTWRKEDQYWRVIVQFLALVGKPGLPRNYAG